MQFIRTCLTLSIFLLVFSNSAFGSETTHLETAKKLVSLFDIEQTYKLMIGAAGANISDMVIKNQPCLEPFKEDVREVSDQIVRKMLPREFFQQLTDEAAKIYVKHYSEGELQELITFYETPIGKKILKLQPQISAESATISMQMLQKSMGKMNVQAETTKLLDERMKSKTLDYSKMTPECRKFFKTKEKRDENPKEDEKSKSRS